MVISIHAPREGERQTVTDWDDWEIIFQSTLPARGSDSRRTQRPGTGVDFNPRSPRGGATVEFFYCFGIGVISIHAPREGERHISSLTSNLLLSFQSTLPARGSDFRYLGSYRKRQDFNPRSPRGERLVECNAAGRQIHFNPRSPRGGATARPDFTSKSFFISIHAPREGERPKGLNLANGTVKFQSTLPARGSDAALGLGGSGIIHFNPRSPRGGATLRVCSLFRLQWNFNPRSPRGGATSNLSARLSISPNFNPRSPRGGATLRLLLAVTFTINFNPRSPRGGATDKA